MEDECRLKWCFYSSLIFLINVVIALYYNYYLYAASFMLLTITSLFYHSHYTAVTRNMDKMVIYLVVFYGGYLFYTKLKTHLGGGGKMGTFELMLSLIIIFTFLSTILFYYYGYRTKSLCFCEDSNKADFFHACMHCVASFGHVCITIL